ncbi:MAG: GH3 family domain-containing protein, partial [Planctomycetota bacterium]
MAQVEELVREGVRKRMETLRDLDARFREVQRDKLLAIVRRNADTEFGRAHGFSGITSEGEYRRAVPPSTAPEYDAAWKRIEAGERDVLFADPVHAFGLSSGTTGEPKTLPMTQPLVRGMKRAIGNATSCYVARSGDYSILRGYALQLAAQSTVRRTAGGVPVGYMTGITGAARSYPFHNIGIPPAEVLDIADWREKYRVIEERYADHDVRLIFGVPGYVLGFLRFLAEKRGLRDTSALWPELRLVVTSGMPLREHRDRIAALCPRAELLEMYMATEAPISFQSDASDPAMRLMVEDVYFEFVPADRWGEGGAPRVPLGAVEPGVPYVILVTTPAGLYAYSPGDVVRFARADPPGLLVDGRMEAVLSLVIEKVDATQAEQALGRAALPYEAFLVCPAAGERLAHEWVVETAGDPPPDAAERIDAALRAINPLYRTVRAGDLLLGPPVFTRVRRGAFDAALGRRPGQGKILRIHQDR